MIWVEILSRHHDVVARFKLAGPEARIGRGYGNDVIVDDPYVAAQHVRILRDESGQLVAEDLGSTNGMFLNAGKERLTRTRLDGNEPIRIGQTFVRVREVDFAVAPERVAPLSRRMSSGMIATLLSFAVLGVGALQIWLAQTGEPKVSAYLTPLSALAATVIFWSGIWALMARVFSGRAHFLTNLSIALAGVVIFALYGYLAQFAAFGWTWETPGQYGYAATWTILAFVCFFHLRAIAASRLVLKGLIVAAVAVVIVTVQTLQQSEAFFDTGRQTTVRQLMPPSFRFAPLRDEATFFASAGNLKNRIDADRGRLAAGK